MGVGSGVFDRDRLPTTCCKPHEAIADRQFDPTDRIGIEADRRSESQCLVLRVRGIDRTGLGVETL